MLAQKIALEADENASLTVAIDFLFQSLTNKFQAPSVAVRRGKKVLRPSGRWSAVIFCHSPRGNRGARYLRSFLGVCCPND